MQWSEWDTIHWSYTHCNFLCTFSLVNWSRSHTCASSWLLYMESCHTRRWLPCSAGESRSRPVVSFPWFDKKVWCDPSTGGIMHHYVTLLCYLPVDSCIMRPYTSYGWAQLWSLGCHPGKSWTYLWIVSKHHVILLGPLTLHPFSSFLWSFHILVAYYDMDSDILYDPIYMYT